VILSGGEIISGPGWTFEAIPTPGHTSNHICYGLAEENALFSGDHIMGWSTTVITPPDGDMGAYFASLDRIQAKGFATLCRPMARRSPSLRPLFRPMPTIAAPARPRSSNSWPRVQPQS
jgi:hypothetical protein